MKNIINKNTIFSFLLGIILCSGIVYATNYLATEISYTKDGWGVNNVSEALDDLYENGAKKAMVFTSSPVDMKQYTDRWAELTTADFKGGWSGGNAWSQTDSGAASGQNAWAYAPSFTLSYDKNTGVLTFSTSKTGEKRWSSGSTLFNRMELTGGFAVWLGTINGK